MRLKVKEMFIIFALKLLAALSISMGIFTGTAAHPQPGSSFTVVGVASSTASQRLHTQIVVSSSLEVLELHTEPHGTCTGNVCVGNVDSAGEILVVALIHVKPNAPIGLQTIRMAAFDNLGNSAGITKAVFIGTVDQSIKQVPLKHRVSYFPVFRR